MLQLVNADEKQEKYSVNKESNKFAKKLDLTAKDPRDRITFKFG